MGRRSTFSTEIAAEICARLSEGEPLAQICRSDGMPGVQTVYDWRDAHDEFAVAIARAREAGHDRIASDCVVIADDCDGDPARDRLRVETRLKLLAKWDPKRYGDKLGIEHSADDSLRDWLVARG